MEADARDTSTANPWWGVWTGRGPAPADLIRLDAVSCTGGCCSGAHECVEPGLTVVVAALGRRMCEHTADADLPCLACSMALRELAELTRSSGAWGLNDGSFDGQVEWALAAYVQAGLLPAGRADALCGAYDGATWPDDYLALFVEELPLTWDTARRLIIAAHNEADRASGEFATGGIFPRDEHHNPRRAAYKRAETEIAARKGWPQPQRFMLEERVRACAVASCNEAQFVRLCTEAGIALIPKTGAPHLGIVAYSTELLDIPAEDRRTYSGMNLAKDLALSALREIQWEEPAALHDNAWATWMSLCSDVEALQRQPPSSSDNRWRWILPSIEATITDAVPQLSDKPTGLEVRAYLHARQGGVCAMCQIRRRGWTATRDVPIPPTLLGPALNLDHDHMTGLIRGLLCTPCNSRAEPAGISTHEDVWSTYTSDPPIGDHRVLYPGRYPH